MLPTSRFKPRSNKDSISAPPLRRRKIVDATNEELQIQPIVKQKPESESSKDPKLQSGEESTLQIMNKSKSQLNSEPISNHATISKLYTLLSDCPSNTQATQNMNTQKISSEPSGKPFSTLKLFRQKDASQTRCNQNSKTNAPKIASESSGNNPGCSSEKPLSVKPNQTEQSISPIINVEEQAPEASSISHTVQHQAAREDSSQLPFNLIVNRNGSVRILREEDMETDLERQSHPPPVENIFDMRKRNSSRPEYHPIPLPVQEYYPVAVPYYQDSRGMQYPNPYYQRAVSPNHYLTPAIQFQQQHYEHIGGPMIPYYALMQRQIPSQQGQHVHHFHINLQPPPAPSQYVQSVHPNVPIQPPLPQPQQIQNLYGFGQQPPQDQPIQHSYPNMLRQPSQSEHVQNSYPLSEVRNSSANKQSQSQSQSQSQRQLSQNQHLQTPNPIIQPAHISKLLQPQRNHLPNHDQHTQLQSGLNQSGQTTQRHNQQACYNTQQPQIPICDYMAGIRVHAQHSPDRRASQQPNLNPMPTQSRPHSHNQNRQHHTHQYEYEGPILGPHYQSLLRYSLNEQQSSIDRLEEEIQRDNIRNIIRSAVENESTQAYNASKNTQCTAKQTQQQATHPIRIGNPDSTTNENTASSMTNTLEENLISRPSLAEIAHFLELRRFYDHQSIGKNSYH